MKHRYSAILIALFLFANSPVWAWGLQTTPELPPAPPAITPNHPTQNELSAFSAKQILTPNMVRIGLAISTTSVQITTPDEVQLRDFNTGKLIATFSPRSSCKITSSPNIITFSPTVNSQIILTANLNSYQNISFARKNIPTVQNPLKLPLLSISNPKQSYKISSDYDPTQFSSDTTFGTSGYLLAATTPDGLISVNNKLYRGAILLQPSTKNSLNIINIVNMEDYLLSVVPSEMPSNWPLEALRAQAIAARSYAYANLGKHSKDGYDVKPNTEDQVYVGVSAESNNSNQAVADTSGIVLKYQSKVIPAFFHSTSGGYTDLAQNIWGKDLPFLQSVPDYDDASPMFSWNKGFSLIDASNKLQSNGYGVGSVESGSIVSRSPASHILSVAFSGTKGTSTVSGEEMRRIFNLPSSSFSLGLDDTSLKFVGRGFGHGLGMSQYGAKALAEHGYNAAQILTYYYKDVVLDYP